MPNDICGSNSATSRLGGLKFRRQMSLSGFVVDFCCPGAKLIIELDGGQHVEQREQDARRTKNLEDSGYFVLRFWNNDVLRNIDGVLEEILSRANQLDVRTPSPHPSPLRGEGAGLSKPSILVPPPQFPTSHTRRRRIDLAAAPRTIAA